jgi:hypothetical protein
MLRTEKYQKILKKLTRYPVPTPERDYRYTPTNGVPNPSLLVNGKPYWPDTVIAEVHRPKTFIITDFSERYNNFARRNGTLNRDSKYKDSRQVWEFLLQEGIKCYVWTGKLTEVKDITSLMIELNNVELVEPAVLDAELLKSNITQDEREIVDVVRDNEIRYELGLSHDENFIFNVGEYTHLNFDDFKRIIQCIPQHGKITLGFQRFDKSEEFISYTIEHLRNIHTILFGGYTTQLVSDIIFNKYKSGVAPCFEKVKNVIVTDSVFTGASLNILVDHLPNDCNLDISVNWSISDNAIQRTGSMLLGNSVKKKVNALRIEGVDSFSTKRDDESEFFKTGFSKPLVSLTHLQFHGMRDREIEITKCIENSPELESLSIEHSSMNYDECLEILLHLKNNDNVVRLSLKNVSISTRGLLALLLTFPNLTELVLEKLEHVDIEGLNTYHSLKNLFPKLLKLTVNNVKNSGFYGVGLILETHPSIENLVTDLPCFAGDGGQSKLKNLTAVKLPPIGLMSMLKLPPIGLESICFTLNYSPETENLDVLDIDKHDEEIDEISKLRAKMSRLSSLTLQLSNGMSEHLVTLIIRKILNNSPNAEYIDLPNPGEVFNDGRSTFRLMKVKTLRIGAPISNNELSNIAKAFPNLESLSCTFADSEIDSTKINCNLEKLTELSIDECHSGSMLSSILKICPNLKRLNIRKFSGDIPAELSLNNIKVMRIRYIEVKKLFELLDRPNYLAELEFEVFPGSHKAEPKHKLMYLKCLTIHNDHYHEYDALNSMVQLVNLCPNLVSLNASLSFKTQLITAPGISFGKVSDLGMDNLRIFGIDITDEQLLMILKHVPKVKIIEINNCKYITSKFATADFTLPLLEQINLCPIKVTAEMINKLRNNCKNLKYISINENDFIRLISDPAMTKYNLKILKVASLNLELLGEEIAAVNLSRVFSLCPNIDYLHNTHVLTDLFTDRPAFKLNGLTTFLHKEGEMSIGQLISFLPHCPNIDIIIFEESQITAKQLFKILIENRSIKKVMLNTQSISLDEINEIKTHFPNVQFQGTTMAFYPSNRELKNQNPPLVSAKKWVQDLRKEGNSHLDELIANHPAMEQRGLVKPFFKSGAPSRIDANFEKNDRIHARCLFETKKKSFPAPNQYRLSVYPKMEIGTIVRYVKPNYPIKQVSEFNKWQNIRNLYDQRYRDTDDVFYGQIEIPANCDDWYPLPSLTAGDKIINLAASVPVELGYCVEQRLYYVKIKSSSPKPLNISFLVNAKMNPFPLDIASAKKIDFSRLRFGADGKLIESDDYKRVIKELSRLEKLHQFAALARFCSNFSDKDMSVNCNSDIEELNWILANANGVCRHRTWVFKALADAFNLTCNAVENDCHAYIEICTDNGWFRQDLGGRYTKLIIEPLKQEVDRQEVNPADKVLSKSKAKEKDEHEELNVNEAANLPVVASMAAPKELSSENPFIVWDRVSTKAENMYQYCHDIITATKKIPGDKRNVLIVMAAQQIEAFRQQMARYLHDKNHNMYYLHSLNDVAEKQAIVNEGKLIVSKSELVDFITAAKTCDVLMSNWSDYKPSFIGYNTMMDVDRKLGTVEIPDDTIVLVVCDENQMQKMREDFTNRFRLIHQSPELPGYVNIREQLQLPGFINNAVYEQALFFDNDWKALLLGAVDIHGTDFTLDDGMLIKAIKGNAAGILLQNAPWDDIEFRMFIDDLSLKRCFKHNGHEYKLPDGFAIHAEEKSYNFIFNQYDLKTEDKEIKQEYVLNRLTFGYFIKNMKCKDNLMFREPGWIEQNSGSIISIVVTEDIPENYWAWLVHESNKHKCAIKLILAPNVSLPAAMSMRDSCTVIDIKESPCIDIIHTNDIELTEEKLYSMHPGATVISINSKTNITDLIERLEKVENSHDLVSFRSVVCSVGKKLFESDNTVILKGDISPALAKQLESLYSSSPYLWINGEKRSLKGRLIIITDSKPASNLMYIKEEKYSPDDIWQKVKMDNEDNINFSVFIESYNNLLKSKPQLKFTYGQMRSMSEKFHREKVTNPFKPYFRLNADEAVLAAAKDVWKKSPRVRQPDVMQRRNTKILSELKNSNYLFVVGPSGVGKSTYILSEFRKAKKNVYVGLDNILGWLQADDNEDSILFVDEANLEREGALDLLEGLFNKTPGLLIDGVFYPVNRDGKNTKKVVLAGNYQHFAGRIEHRLFARHGQGFNFKEMPDDVLANIIIKPALDSVLPDIPDSEREKITEVLLKVYSEINSTISDHPLTPRNLNMICLRIRAYIENHSNELEDSSDTAIKLAILDEVESVLDKQNKIKLRAALGFNEIDKVRKNKIRAKLPLKLGKYQVSKSRKQVLHALHEQFVLRDLKLADQELNYLDVPGILLEGMPRIGKSDILLQYLESQGFKQAGTPESVGIDTNKTYYKITPTDPEVMQATLLKAFHEGSVVIVDEMNSLPFEKLMNHLISGYDLQGKRAEKSGFMILATQNPIDFSNRQKLSAALINRFLKIELKNYSNKELYDIGNRICHNQDIANIYVSEYIAARDYAKKHNKIPEPTPGDLFSYLGKLLSQQEEVISGTEIKPKQGHDSFCKFFQKSPVNVTYNNHADTVQKQHDKHEDDNSIDDFVAVESAATIKSALNQKIGALLVNRSADVEAYLAKLNLLINQLKPSNTSMLPDAKIIALLNLKLQLLENASINNHDIEQLVREWKSAKPLYGDYTTNYALISENERLKKVLNLFWRPDTQEFIDDYFIKLVKRK